jgi:hypothetical protein
LDQQSSTLLVEAPELRSATFAEPLAKMRLKVVFFAG